MVRDVEIITASDLIIRSLGDRTTPAPIWNLIGNSQQTESFVKDKQRILVDDSISDVMDRIENGEEIPSLELAGPRREIYFTPSETTCAVVTCGGLCPGLNDVIRSLVHQAHYRYGVKRFYGIRYGYEGLIPEYGHAILELTPELVNTIHQFGGTFLGTSRGPQDVGRLVDRLEELGVNILFVVGGDGSLRGGGAIADEAARRRIKLAVVGVPKTIDNDLVFMDKSFGYETAFAEAVQSVHAAHTEALGSRNGVGLVKLMGRYSGFIACSAALATGEANFVLIPEVPFGLEGENGLLELLRKRIEQRGHAMLVVAEGAGQEHMIDDHRGRDASGNAKLGDIGLFLKDRINGYFQGLGMELNLKYIDPSYIVRSVPASPQDRVYCSRLAQAAVHAGMAGKTSMVVARWHGSFVHVPLKVTTSARRTVSPSGDIWLSVLESTGQPARIG